MKVLILLAAIVVAVLSKPPLKDPKVSVTQSTSGSYSIHYNTGTIRRDEKRDKNGEVIGSYSYIDSDGKLQIVNYRAGAGGFMILPGSTLPYMPKVVTDTPEVAAAKRKHQQLLQAWSFH